MGHFAVAGIFSQENPGRNPCNHTADESQNDEVHRVKEHIAQAMGAKGEHFRCHAFNTLYDNEADKGDEQDDGKTGTADKQGGHNGIRTFLLC